MNKKKVLVTGCAGFIGSHLTEKLLSRGDYVTGIDNFDPFYPESIKRKNIANVLQDPFFTFYENSILDSDKLQELFSSNKFSHVVHLAAKAGVRPSIQQPVLYQKYNIEATALLLEQCRIHGIHHFIFASSSSVYGNNKKVPFAEEDNVDFPVSPYAATKKAGELLCYTYHHLYKMNIFAMRFFTVYGPRQRPEMAIHKFTRLIDQGKTIQLYGFGKPKRDYTYIEDIIQGLLKAVDNVKGYEILNLGESQTISTANLVHLIEEALGKKALIDELPMQPGDVDQTYANIDKAKAILNYHPKTKIEKGVTKFINWYQENKLILSH